MEFVPYLDKCEFQGCSHIKEENCGVKEALEAGKISSQRYENYIKFIIIYHNAKKYYIAIINIKLIKEGKKNGRSVSFNIKCKR